MRGQGDARMKLAVKNIVYLLSGFLCFISASSFAQKPDLFLLKTYQDDKAVTGWLMSEKLDGVRAYWDGHQLISRGGYAFNAPMWFTRDFPAFALDGELWSKRSDFENIVSIVRSQQADESWEKIRYRIFEVPNQSGGLLARLVVLRNYLEALDSSPPDNNPSQLASAEDQPAYLNIIPQIEVKNQLHLKAFLQKIVDQGGEGVVVRDPEALYQTGRLSSALKVKLFQDKECEVTAYHPGRGKYKDLVGSLVCRLDDKTLIRIGSGLNDKQRKQPPTIGSTITFKYYGLTAKGRPRFPVFLRQRSPTQAH